MTKVTVNYKVYANQKSSFEIIGDCADTCGIYIYSHKLTPEALILNANDFIIDGVKYSMNTMIFKMGVGLVIKDDKEIEHQLESQWWQEEMYPYDLCCHKIDEFSLKCSTINVGESFEWDFSDLKMFRSRRGFVW